jgi:hypothetical protein
VHAPGLTPTAVLEKLADINMIDVWIPTVDQRWLILPPPYTQPSPDTKLSSEFLLIEKLKLHLRSQQPPRLVGQNESSKIQNRSTDCPAGGPFVADSKALNRLRGAQLGKFG